MFLYVEIRVTKSSRNSSRETRLSVIGIRGVCAQRSRSCRRTRIAGARRAPSASALRSVAGLANTACRARREGRTRPRRHGVVRRTRCVARPRSFFDCVMLISDVRSEALNKGKIRMREDTRTRQLREASNPLFSDRKLRLGTFSTNLSGGCAISSIDGVLEADWTSTLTLAQLADEMQFEALVPVGRWKGFGGVTNFNGAGFEILFVGRGDRFGDQSNSGVFATSHVPDHSPGHGREAGDDDRSHHARTLQPHKIVTGWYQPEIEMFGEPQMEHDARYDRAVEWLEVIKRLWTAEEEFDYEGRFYKVAKGWCMPKPIQQPYPGGDERGRVGTGTALRGEILRRGIPQSRLERCRLHQEADRCLQGTGAQGIWPRRFRFGATPISCRARRKRKQSLSSTTTCTRKGDWEAAENLVNMLGLNCEESWGPNG